MATPQDKIIDQLESDIERLKLNIFELKGLFMNIKLIDPLFTFLRKSDVILFSMLGITILQHLQNKKVIMFLLLNL